jgi:hypothetical protein
MHTPFPPLLLSPLPSFTPMSIHTRIHTCMHIHMHTHKHTHTHTCISFFHPFLLLPLCLYIRAYIHACTCICIHTNTHTHMYLYMRYFFDGTECCGYISPQPTRTNFKIMGLRREGKEREGRSD